jgi:hypothetical protein
MVRRGGKGQTHAANFQGGWGAKQKQGHDQGNDSYKKAVGDAESNYRGGRPVAGPVPGQIPAAKSYSNVLQSKAADTSPPGLSSAPSQQLQSQHHEQNGAFAVAPAKPEE